MSFPKPFYRWRPHPWHGLSSGPRPPEIVCAFIEITPFDAIKYEIDKETGYLQVDRPQRTSSLPPALYGFIPRTYCGMGVGLLSGAANKGDNDPLDICVLSERPINRAECLMNARVIGGIRMLDRNEADDKIIAVLANDNIYGQAKDITDVPSVLVERLEHYFATYKNVPGAEQHVVLNKTYGAEEARKVVNAAMEDYIHEFGGA